MQLWLMDVHRRSRKTESACRLPPAFSARDVGTRDGAGKLRNIQTEKFTSQLVGKLALYVPASSQVTPRARGLNLLTTSECSRGPDSLS